MAEYITKEQALTAVLSTIELSGNEWLAVYNNVNAIPAADVAPVVHARWEETDWETWRCTNCGCEWQFFGRAIPRRKRRQVLPTVRRENGR